MHFIKLLLLFLLLFYYWIQNHQKSFLHMFLPFSDRPSWTPHAVFGKGWDCCTVLTVISAQCLCCPLKSNEFTPGNGSALTYPARCVLFICWFWLSTHFWLGFLLLPSLTYSYEFFYLHLCAIYVNIFNYFHSIIYLGVKMIYHLVIQYWTFSGSVKLL